jgi:hypothetical protein
MESIIRVEESLTMDESQKVEPINEFGDIGFRA